MKPCCPQYFVEAAIKPRWTVLTGRGQDGGPGAMCSPCIPGYNFFGQYSYVFEFIANILKPGGFIPSPSSSLPPSLAKQKLWQAESALWCSAISWEVATSSDYHTLSATVSTGTTSCWKQLTLLVPFTCQVLLSELLCGFANFNLTTVTMEVVMNHIPIFQIRKQAKRD